MWELCKIYRKTPDDPFFEEMDPVQKMWMYMNWLGDQNEQADLAKNMVYLLASFSHPEEVKKLIGGGNKVETTEDEFEDSWNIIKNYNNKLKNQSKKNKKRKRGTVTG